MTTLCKWCITLVVCILIATHGAAQMVAITSSQEANPTHKMDETWSSLMLAKGYTATIYPTTILSDTDLRSKADLLIISSGLTNISNNQRSNILKFLQSGGNIYIQSEYLSTYDGNKLFQYLVEKTGGTFQWEGQVDNNVGPIKIINGFEEGLDSDQLDYFWYGAYGCGDAQVTPFIEIDNNYYAFYYRSIRTDIGHLITNSDHDWIRRIEDNRAPRKALMNNIIDILANGISHTATYATATIEIESDINFCTTTSISATVTSANTQDIQWYVNGTTATTGGSIDIQNMTNGDSIYALVNTTNGCGDATAISDTIVIVKENYSPSYLTTFTGNTTICPGTMMQVDIDYDSSLPNTKHHWFLNGQDTPIRSDYFTSSDLKDGDNIEHSMTYYDGCEDVELITDGSVNIQWEDTSIPTINITGQSTFCVANTTDLSIPNMGFDNPTIQWHLNGQVIPENNLSISVDATSVEKEIFATIRYYHNCNGWTTISTPVKTVGIQNLEINLKEKANHDCEHGEGFIEIQSNMANVTYEWNNGQYNNKIANLSEGIYTVTATSDAGCQVTRSYEISKTTFPLIKSIDIDQPTCNNGYGKVMLHLADNNLNDINARWINDQGQVVSTSLDNNNLSSGKYSIHLDVNGNCEEIHEVQIDSYHEDQHVEVDTMVVERGESITLTANMVGYGSSRIEWRAHPDLSCLNCLDPQMTASVHHRFIYFLISSEGCRVEKALLVIVKIRDPYYAPSAFSPNNDGINDYYKIQPRSDVFPTSSLRVFDRWGSLIHEEDHSTQGWDGKSLGQPIQKGVFVFVQQFEDTLGKKYTAKGSITVF